MDLAALLVESFNLLKTKPKAVIPRLATTAIYSAVILSVIWLTDDIYASKDPAAIKEHLQQLILLTLTMPAVYYIDLLTYAMYPRIVADYRTGREISLTAALKDGLGAWKTVAALGAVLFGFILMVSAAASALAAASITTGNILYAASALLLAAALTITFSVAVFFVVPSAVLDGGGVVSSFKKSFRLGVEYKGDLLKLNIIFLLLVLVTAGLAYTARSDKLVSTASLLAFLLVRFIEALVYAYLSVTNPLAYLQVDVNNTRRR